MIEPGTLLQNRYRVTKQIGQGGMGAVYVATDERFGSTVAVKQTFFDDPALRKAFEREAHLLNHLRHTALPKVSDHFTEGAGQFLVMEFIPGSDLSELLQQRRGAFPLSDVLRWADELLDALDYLHTHEPQVVHRDIKPQNLKLTPRGQMVLLDFGLAKGTPAQNHASATASVFGYSRNYAPLEQIQGTGTDARSDLYSLGATLYHLLTGVAPVDALTRAAAVVNAQPDPLRPAHLAHAQVPASVGDILGRALAQNPAMRPATASELRASLRQAAAAVNPYAARQTPSAAAPLRGRSAFEQTMMSESPTGSPGLQPTVTPRAGAVISETQQRQSQMPRTETTVVDATQRAPRRAPGPYAAAQTTHTLPPEATARKSPAKLFGVGILALLVVSAVVAFTLNRGSGASAARPATQTEMPLGASTEAQVGTPDATGATSSGETHNTFSVGGNAPSSGQTQAAPVSGEASRTTPQFTTGQTQAKVGADPSANAANAVSNEAQRSSSTTDASGRPGLVIHAPAPSPVPFDSNAARADEERRRAARDEEARRDEEFRRSQMRPPPPRPEDRGFPPPDGHRPPPPHFP
ncbi:MAG TPA: protein kinase [Pyrinomonadaceae bacterium]|nr:protein kinase [Pyrinomonadaceae bacterium]